RRLRRGRTRHRQGTVAPQLAGGVQGEQGFLRRRVFAAGAGQQGAGERRREGRGRGLLQHRRRQGVVEIDRRRGELFVAGRGRDRRQAGRGVPHANGAARPRPGEREI